MANATHVIKRQEHYKALEAQIFQTRWEASLFNLGVSSSVLSVSSKTILRLKYVPTPSADTTLDDLSLELELLSIFIILITKTRQFII